MTKIKLQYFLLGGYSVFCLLADSANMAEPQTDDARRIHQLTAKTANAHVCVVFLVFLCV